MSAATVPQITEHTRAIVERLRIALEGSDFGAVASLYAPDAVLDAVVPHWRYQLQGPRAIGDEFNAAYPAPVRIVHWRKERGLPPLAR